MNKIIKKGSKINIAKREKESKSYSAATTDDLDASKASNVVEDPAVAYQFHPRTIPFNTKETIQKAKLQDNYKSKQLFKVGNEEFVWGNQLERIQIIRSGIPYQSIEIISKRLDVSIKSMLELLNMPQTTYNKKKSEDALLDERYTELILSINSILDYGQEVFNLEKEKFLRWLKKPNISLANNTPVSMLDTISGVNEVRNCLNRLEFGNLA